MTITMPSGLQHLASIVAGNFPQGDEDALWRLSDAWNKCAGEVESVLGDTEAAIKDALATMEGQTADAFKKYGDSLTQGDKAPFVVLHQLCEQIGDACDKVANEVQYTKISIIVALSILLAQIAVMLAMAVLTFGASTAAIPAAEAVTQGVVRGLIEALVKMVQEIIKQIVLNEVTNLGVDAAIQGGQELFGHRKQWDTSLTKGAALSGVAGGLGGGIAGGVFGGVAKSFGGKLLGDGLGASLGTDMAEGTAGGVMGGAMNNKFQGNQPNNAQSMGSSALGGAVGGGVAGLGDYRSGLSDTPSTSSFGSPAGQTPGVNAPDPHAGAGVAKSAPDNSPAENGRPNSDSLWQEWDSAPPLEPDPTPTENHQPEPGAGNPAQGAGAAAAPHQSVWGDLNNPDEWRPRWYDLPPHMVNPDDDAYGVDTNGIEQPDQPKPGSWSQGNQ